MYVVLKVYHLFACGLNQSHVLYFIGDWSNGMIGVSKTFGGSSILSSPAKKHRKVNEYGFPVFFMLYVIGNYSVMFL